tara:strand:+ start:8830 stop:12096 length:3267 start_codon:yes stop_codon:yes gene_type:complete
MAKDIRIELLQSRENVRIGGQMLSNSEFSTSTGWTSPALSSTDSFTFNGYQMRKLTTGNGAARATIVQDFVEGYQYEAVFAVRNYNRVGSLLLANHGVGGANITLLNSTIVPSGGAGTTSDYGYYSTKWIQGSSNIDKLSVYANDGTELELTYLRVYRTAVDKSSIFGVLDASTTEDFPLALTFSVNDPSNIDARKGAFSKTFQVPATKNNNRVLKHFNIANSTHQDAQLYEKIPCRILVGNLFSLKGLLQVQNIERLNDKPILYSCIFLGDNLAWSTTMEGRYLSDLQLKNSTNLKLSAANIADSWTNDNATSKTDRAGVTTENTSPVTYPLASYGQVNETGYDYGDGFQMFKEQWEIDYMNNVTYNVSQTGFLGANQQKVEPVMDWRPLVWIYNMYHKIFNDVGYRISSNFIESDNFKRLLYATPNFLYNNANARKQSNTYIGNFNDNSSCAATQANLKIFDHTETWTFNVQNVGGVQTYDNTFQTPYDAIRFGGTCGSGDGSGRFQPAPNVITTSAGQQQELKIMTAAVGNQWTIDKAGYYTVSTQNIMYFFNWDEADWSGSGSIVNNSASGMTIYGNICVQVKRVANSTWETISSVDNASADALSSFTDCNNDYSFGGTLPSKSSTHYFNEDDLVRLTFGVAPIVKVSSPSINFSNTTQVEVRTELFGTAYNDWTSSNGIVTIELVNEQIPVWGGTYDLQDVFPTDQKQLDFVKGVAHAFNLQFYTQESSKTVFIEPFNDFYLPPRDAVNWTHKLARNLSDVQSFIESNWTRKLIFKYKTDDKDWRVNSMSEAYFDSIGDNYPQQVELPNTYPAGETIFENPFFAGTYDSKNYGAGETVTYGENAYTAALWKASYWYSSTKGYEFKPRMLYYNKMTMPVQHDPLWQGFKAEIGEFQNSLLFGSRKVQIAPTDSINQNQYNGLLLNTSFYCTATFINRYDFSNQFGLSYGNYWAKDYDPSTNSFQQIGNQVGKGLYTRYYKPMILGLQARPKMRVCYIDLKITDITKLDFRKMVYIDGVYYRLVKVIDFQPHKNEPTKVELHQWSPNEGSSFPTEGVWVNNNSGNTGGGIFNPDGSAPNDPVNQE